MFKRQYFILGASVGYGVGGTSGGWSSMLKSYVHNQLYRKGGKGEKAEVYNFAKPGAQINFVYENLDSWLREFKRSKQLTAFLLVGLNDTKAVEKENNYLSNKEKFEKDYTELLNKMITNFEKVNVLGYSLVDESKLNPKISPFDGSKSYFKNNRIVEFNSYLKSLCAKFDKVSFIDLDNLSNKWIEECLWDDGLHPNDVGHEMIFEKVKTYLSDV